MFWKGLEEEPRLMIEASLASLQGGRFQPTGFPELGPAEYTAPDRTQMLLVESVQSMANHLEAVCWDEAQEDLIESLRGLPYVKATLPDGRVTSSILEAHRLNSPYILGGPKGVDVLPDIAALKDDPTNLRKVSRAVFKYDPNSVLHGVFLTRVAEFPPRLRRILSAFIEARNVHPVDSGGTKMDYIDPTGKKWQAGGAEEGYGHVPFHRREYTAEEIKAYFSLDLAQLRAYRLGPNAGELLVGLALYKIQRFLKHGLRLRTACDLRLDELEVVKPEGFELPSLGELQELLPQAISRCSDMFVSPPVTELTWRPPKKKTRAEPASQEEA